MSTPLSEYEIDTMQVAHGGHMGFTCRISRSTSSTTDAYGHPSGLTWGVFYEGPCDFSEQSEAEVTGTIAVIVTSVKVLLPIEGLGVTPADRIDWVRNHHGVAVVQALDIREVLQRIDGVDVISEETD